MNFSRIFFIVFACVVALTTVMAAPEPRWKFFKKIIPAYHDQHDGQHDGSYDPIDQQPAVEMMHNMRILTWNANGLTERR
ncbi:Cecropin B, partial [Operophtera brumata]